MQTKSKNPCVHLESWMLRIIFIMLLITTTFLSLMYFDAKETVTKEQAKRIALSYAYEDCLSRTDPVLDCTQLRIGEPKLLNSDLVCRDCTTYWDIGWAVRDEGGGIVYIRWDGKLVTTDEP